MNRPAVDQVLAGCGSYDSLGEPEQAIVRDEWAGRVTTLRSALNYEDKLRTAGESYSELDENSGLVIHGARD